MRPFTIYTAECTGNARNCQYPTEVIVQDIPTLELSGSGRGSGFGCSDISGGSICREFQHHFLLCRRGAACHSYHHCPEADTYP